MVKRVSALGVAALGLLVSAGVVDASPIDCRKAKGEVDREICASGELKAMDREIAALYDRSMASLPPDDRRRLADNQRGFVKRRLGCNWAAHNSAHPGVAVEECVRNTMESRVQGLRKVVDSGSF